MNIHIAPTLEGLRAALKAEPSQQMPIFLQEVMEPIRPCWEPSLRFLGAPQSDQNPAQIAAERFLFYTPTQGTDRGLDALDRIEASGAAQESLEGLQKAIELLQPANHGIGLQVMNFVFVLGDPDRMTPPYYTGVGNVPGWILLMAFPTADNLSRLSPITVHEFHHQIRFQYEPFFPLTLGKYLVAEGLAECFAAHMYGEEKLGPWATTLRPEELEAIKPRYADALMLSDFTEVRGYIFGDWAAKDWGTPAMGIPDFAGYAIGYRMVEAFLKRTGKSIVEATYLPWQEIVQGSGYLDTQVLQ
ncbi:DUF2268 domain-containing protein [Deinococcus cellulosilyticus]|uniref:DUF2268 domain-containing protein n=1 Tax=Deinococcus cellulosilyticus (strain DSM 18568 / NBRC 106333 / KACC 11606 / 5516J-15) TaxID=1223518 RepID=A0A511MV54_DEIC1|nr:DUF2268 domain-containing putative Zn-dependent protease [Deinococcus cellulosilyticus]GEM44460.1 hypothetical protein DC3_00950 [Deinococcus cellulosilyticus NBRC 106333 = KACC 11606]